MGQKRVLLLCGDYVEDAEAMVLLQSLQTFGVPVDAVCPGKKSGDICRTAIHQSSRHQNPSVTRGHNFALNATFDEIEAKNYDGLVIRGGKSPEYLAHIPSVVELVTKFARTGNPIAAICHGPLILAAAGAIKGRKCTAYRYCRQVLAAAGAHWVKPECSAVNVVDDNLITGVGYKGNPEFIQHFVKALGGSISGFNKRILFLCGVCLKHFDIAYCGVVNGSRFLRYRAN